MEKEKIKILIDELQKYDNQKGYKLKYGIVKGKLGPVIENLILCKDECLDELHELIKYEKTWSCLFALEIIKEIKSEKSINYLINYIVKTEEGEYGNSGEQAMFALTNIGKLAIEPLINEIKNQFSKRKFYFYLTGALTEIKDEKVYEFMREVSEDYIRDEDKYDEWFHIDAFASDFDKQCKIEALSLLKEIVKLDRLSKSEKIEIIDTIERTEDPIGYQKKTKEEIEKMKPFFEKFMAKKNDGSDIAKEELKERMQTPEDDISIQFRCRDCHKKQNINSGLIKILDGKKGEFNFENEILCKFCFSNNIKLSVQGERDIMFQAIGTVSGSRKGVALVNKEIYVENKLMSFNKSYDYILKRLNEEPNNAGLFLRAGNVARNFNKYSEAIKYYEKSLELNPKLIASYLNLVEVYEFRYKYYGLEGAKISARFYLNEMMDVFRTQNFNTSTLQNKGSVIQFIGEKSESLGISFPELIKIPIQAKKEKVGRNDPCPCGSGKKYKKCCFDKEIAK